MAGIDHDRQMGQALEHRHGADVQRVAGGRFKGADTPFTQNNEGITRRQNILRRHEQLFDRCHHPSLEQHRFTGMADFLEQGEVLNIARADLQHVGIRFHQIHVRRIDHFGHRRQTCFFADGIQHFQAFLLHPLEAVRRGARFESPAP